MYLFWTFGLQTFGGTLIIIRETCVVTLSHFEYSSESSDGRSIQLLSELLTLRNISNYRHAGEFLPRTIIDSNTVSVQA